MRVILFGASGMVGQGVLRECLLDPDVTHILSIGRSATGQRDPKLRELVHRDFTSFDSIESELADYDACFFCLGVSAGGMSEVAYEQVTYGFTMAAARTLARLNPAMTFVYVSGTGTDSTGAGRIMWARVKGKTENALLGLFPNAYMFRPSIIRPMHGIRSKTKAYQLFYTVAGPLLPLIGRMFPKHFTTTERLGRAMLVVAKCGGPKHLLESAHIDALGAAAR